VAVSRVAERLATLIAEQHPVDDRLLTVGALLHDIGRNKTQHPVLHGVEGFRLLSDLGHHREAFICASHVFCGMPRNEAVRFGLPDRDFLPQTLEERLVPLIDCVVELDQPTTVAERCTSIYKRYEGNREFLDRFRIAASTATEALQNLQTHFNIFLEHVARETLENKR
jgi:uncharacterized protein